MGLIKAALGSAGGVLADQWKEYFYCESMPADVLVTKAHKKVSGRSSNRHGAENIISNGSYLSDCHLSLSFLYRIYVKSHCSVSFLQLSVSSQRILTYFWIFISIS